MFDWPDSWAQVILVILFFFVSSSFSCINKEQFDNKMNISFLSTVFSTFRIVAHHCLWQFHLNIAIQMHTLYVYIHIEFFSILSRNMNQCSKGRIVLPFNFYSKKFRTFKLQAVNTVILFCFFYLYFSLFILLWILFFFRLNLLLAYFTIKKMRDFFFIIVRIFMAVYFSVFCFVRISQPHALLFQKGEHKVSVQYSRWVYFFNI